ncbi:beta-glucan synthesis-associated [Marasmius fiardii PR-910]|nr:beta-glucan synthesis-associated [Marasmius fiardii PR-910]
MLSSGRNIEYGTHEPHSPGSYRSRYSNEGPPRSTIRAGHFASRSPSVRNNPYNVSATPGHRAPPSLDSSVADKYSLPPDPQEWGTSLTPSFREEDDLLHNPDPARDRKIDRRGNVFTSRGFANLGCVAILVVALVGLFAGYPLVTYFTSHDLAFFGGFNIGGINASGQIPQIAGNRALIDVETPQAALSIQGYLNNVDMDLVYSDEFNTEGRTFYPGDDPYWEAVDLHYWQTNNMEWYDPEAITTRDGALEITLSRKETHDLHFQGGMMSTWNKFCFTGGVYLASVQLPGIDNIAGLWPAVWAMGNLGRAGYGASLEGMWPYTYDACDVGTVKNQTVNGQPSQAVFNSPEQDENLSFLPGQRLSKCTCPGEDHPGPVHEDGSFVGRSAPEIDVLEAQVQNGIGAVSQSGQWAPFDKEYRWENTADTFVMYDTSVTQPNGYLGGPFQEATSCVTTTNPDCYQLSKGCFAVYGFEYKPGFDDAYITWIANGKKAWTLYASAVGQNNAVQISARPVPQEPMYLIVNLGMSTNFGDVDLEHLTFPAVMRVDWIRVYQEKGKRNLGCDPKEFPTKAYIDKYVEAYTNPNLTTWVDDFKQTIPKNSFLKQC